MNQKPATASATNGTALPDLPLDQILDAALRCVLNNGFENVTVDDIVRASAVPRTTIYRRIGGRDAILAALVIRLGRANEHNIQTIAAGDGTIWERLERMIVAAVLSVDAHPWLKAMLQQGLPLTSTPVQDAVSRSLGSDAVAIMLRAAFEAGDWPAGLPLSHALHWLMRQISSLAADSFANEEALALHVRRFLMPVFLSPQPAPPAADIATRLAALERTIRHAERRVANGRK